MNDIRFFLLFCIISVSSCSPSKQLHNSNIEASKAAIRDADINFSNLSAKIGAPKAFAEYAADDVIRLNSRAFPTLGKAALLKEAKESKENSTRLTWKPLRVEVAASGDLGASYGQWQATFARDGKDTTTFGNYVTVWKKQADGSWKFLMDGGGPTPGPVEKLF